MMTAFMTRRALLGGLALVAAAPPLTGKPMPMTTMSLEELEAATERAAGEYMSGTANIPALYAQMRAWLHAAAQHNRGPHAGEAQHVMAWQCALLGALAAGQGNIPLAKGYAATVRSLGERCGDVQAVSRAHIAAAQVECWPGGKATQTVKLAAEGLARTSPHQREQYARLAALLMEGTAKLGDRTGFNEALTLARKAHAHLDAKPSTLFGFSAQQMHCALSTALADVHDRSAVDHAEMSIIRYPDDAPAVKMLAEFPKAYALAKTGSPDDAVGVALAAMPPAPSWLQRDRGRWVLQALPERYDSPQKQHLQELVRTA